MKLLRIAAITLALSASSSAFAEGWTNRELGSTGDRATCLKAAEATFKSFSGVWTSMDIAKTNVAVYAYDVGMKGDDSADMVIYCFNIGSRTYPKLIAQSEGNAETRKSQSDAVKSEFKDRLEYAEWQKQRGN